MTATSSCSSLGHEPTCVIGIDHACVVDSFESAISGVLQLLSDENDNVVLASALTEIHPLTGGQALAPETHCRFALLFCRWLCLAKDCSEQASIQVSVQEAVVVIEDVRK